MSRLKANITFVLLFAFIWFILSEGQGGIFTFLFGIVLSYICLNLASDLLDFNYADMFYIPVSKALKYFFHLVIAIYKSGIITSYCIITNKANPIFLEVKLDKRIKNPFLQHIIGNSITLTPGTITINNKNGKLTVLCLHHTPSDESPSAPFERQMLQMQNKEDT